jgi:sugar O-acyltransferase (sialic acid O-acetyltransferase NeuD family)
MTDIIIIGAGGHGAELDEYIQYSNQLRGIDEYKVIGFLDDNPDNYANYSLSAPLLGGVRDHIVRHDCAYLMGIANLKYRKHFVVQYLKQGAVFVSLIHPTAYISPSSTIGKGVVIAPMANIGPNVTLGDFTLINSRCSMGHDTHLGKYNFISPNVCFSGFTTIGDENLFGINSATIPGIKVGNHNKIAAGMVLDKNVGSNEVVFYRFKEKVIALPKIEE